MEIYFVLEDAFNPVFYLYEKNGDFYDHADHDLLIATFEDGEYAGLVCKLLNENHMKD
jgi:hypothetical protein